jgi:hypothetical protein
MKTSDADLRVMAECKFIAAGMLPWLWASIQIFSLRDNKKSFYEYIFTNLPDIIVADGRAYSIQLSF